MTNQPTMRPLQADDYPAARALWHGLPGLQPREEDNPTAFAAFLARNDGLSLGVWQDEALIAAVLAGHDGRRAYLYHFAVTPDRQRQGIGRRLAAAIEQRLAGLGLARAHLFVLADNAAARAFWAALGWQARDELVVFSRPLDAAPATAALADAARLSCRPSPRPAQSE